MAPSGFSQTFGCPCLSSSTVPPPSPLITSRGLFLPVSYDVLWPCSGSQTVTLLSLCHLINTPFLVTWRCTHTHTHSVLLSVCVFDHKSGHRHYQPLDMCCCLCLVHSLKAAVAPLVMLNASEPMLNYDYYCFGL